MDRVLRTLCALGLCVGLAACQAEHFEVIELVALEDVLLVSPAGQFAPTLEPVATLAVGHSAVVRSCTPRKTHTDIEITFNGSAAVVWKGSYRLVRRAAVAPEPNATSSCGGLTKS